MKDPVFAGKDVAEAVRLASRTLALPEAGLRYVVLDKGQVGGRGLSATEAKIAVLLDHGGSADGDHGRRADGDTLSDADWERGRRSGRRAGRAMHAERRAEDETPESAVRAAVAEMARAAGVELSVELRDGRDGVEVQLDGAGTRLFFEERGETLAAFEHVVERIYGRSLAGRRVRVRCAGYRDYRDEVLREQALELARQVRTDGDSRTTSPLNAYERRVIHVALEGEPGVVTFSVGEGAGRRVTVAPRGEDAVASEARAPEGPSAAADAKSAAVAGGGTDGAGASGEPHRAVEFDARRFDRPPEGGGASELM